MFKYLNHIFLCLALWIQSSISIASETVTKDEATIYQMMLMFSFLPDDLEMEIDKKVTRVFDEKGDRTSNLIENAKNGDRVSQSILGISYFTGLNKKIPKNISKAEFYFKKSAEKGFLPSYNNLAELIYCYKPKSKKNDALIFQYLSKAVNFPSSIINKINYKLDKKHIQSNDLHEMKNELLHLKLHPKNDFWNLIGEWEEPDFNITLARVYSKLNDYKSAEILLTSSLNATPLIEQDKQYSQRNNLDRHLYLIRAIRASQNSKQIPTPNKSVNCY